MTIPEIADLILEDLVKVSAIKHNTLGVPGFHTEMKHLHVSAAQLRAVEDKWIKVLYDFTSEEWINLCLRLVQLKVLECQMLAYELLWKNKKVLKSLDHDQILQMGGVLDNWASVDAYSLIIAGWLWREGNLPDQQIMKWLRSENRWMRRVAVVCTVPLNLKSRGGTGDPERTLMVCKKVISDRDDMVIKALSWALRVLSKADRQAVVDFMEEYQEQLHSRVIREVTAKLVTGRKNG